MADTAWTRVKWHGKRVLVLSPSPTSPENYGNRRRIRRVLSDLSEAGAEITFVHYASELEWREVLPADAQAEMRQMWDDYYLVTPTIWLHSGPTGSHHEIDDWWDPAIETFLRWLFERATFDVFIVNYTWLSRALTLAPPGVLRVLDTHDRFAERKELLQSQGIAPEFFYLRDDATEKVALERADVVWAIKEQEAKHFSGFVDRKIVTLPYMQNSVTLPVVPPDPEGVLRVGIIGAGNNINRINIERFVGDFRMMARKYFAPVHLVVAGSVCDELSIQGDVFVSLIGRVEAIEDFYNAVDVVCIPMEFSTGLKIKTGEALSFGKPVVSTAHGFEGYVTAEALHLLPDLKAVITEIIKLSFEPERLEPLRLADKDVVRQTVAQITSGLSQTIAQTTDRFRGMLVVNGDTLRDDSVLAQSILELIGFLSHLGAIKLFVASGTLIPSLVLDRVIARTGRILADPSVVLSGSLGAGRTGLQQAEFAEALDELQPKIVVLDTCLTDEQMTVASAADRATWCARVGLMSIQAPDLVQAQLAALTPEMLIVPKNSAWVNEIGNSIGARIMVCPSYTGSKDRPKCGRIDRAYVRPDIIILSDHNQARARLLQSAFGDLGWSARLVSAHVDANPALAADLQETAAADLDPPLSALWMMQQLAAGCTQPVVAIDLTQGRLESLALLELLDRRDVPVMQLTGLPVSEVWPYVHLCQTLPGFSGLLRDVERCMARYPAQFGTDERYRHNLIREYGAEAGWAALWQYFKSLVDNDNNRMLAAIGI